MKKKHLHIVWEKKKQVLTILPYVEGLVQATVLNAPVADQLGVGSAQVDLLIGQLEEGGILIRADAVGAELIEGSVFLLGTGAEVRTWLQRGGRSAEVSLWQKRRSMEFIDTQNTFWFLLS